MVTDSFLSVACAGLIGIMFGLALCLAGYRLFLVLLPIWGFFFGLSLGAQTIQVLLGEAFLASITSWVVGLIAGAIIAVLSYMFYIFTVAIAAGSLGYGAAVGILLALGLRMGLLVWAIGIVVAIALVIVTLRFDLAKWVISLATAILGAATTVGALLLMFYPHTTIMENPVRFVLSQSPITAILFVVLAALGIVAQFRFNRRYTVEQYDRWSAAAS